MTVERIEVVIDELEAAVRKELPQMRYIFVEPDARYLHHHDERAVPQ